MDWSFLSHLSRREHFVRTIMEHLEDKGLREENESLRQQVQTVCCYFCFCFVFMLFMFSF